MSEDTPTRPRRRRWIFRPAGWLSALATLRVVLLAAVFVIGILTILIFQGRFYRQDEERRALTPASSEADSSSSTDASAPGLQTE